jgi:Ca2+-binding RTX toxin-like protein
VLTGAFDADGKKHLQSDNGAWNTNLLAIDLTPANNDSLAGGTGDDVLFGQRGNDLLNGDADNDAIFGDGATNLSSVLTDLPHVFNGLRLISTADGVLNPIVLDTFGASFMVPWTLNPEVMDLNAPYATSLSSSLVLPDVTDGVLNQVGAQNPERADGTNLKPLVAFIPDVVEHVGVLPGNDTIDGGTGNDLLVGDNATVYAPLVTGFTEIDTAATEAQNALDLVRHSLRSLSADFDHLEHDVQNVVHSHDITIGEDCIRGGDGIDNIFGDDAVLLTPYVSGLQVPQDRFIAAALAAHNYLADVRQAALDLESVVFEAHYQVLRTMIAANASVPSRVASGPDHNHHDLFIGNDTIASGAGDDLVFGDWALLGTPIVTGLRLDQVQLGSNMDASTWEAVRFVLANQETTRKNLIAEHIQRDQNRLSRTIATATLSQLVADYDFDLTMGNDSINGNEGNDVLFGDFGIVVAPLVLQSPPLPGAQTPNLDQTIQVLLNDVGGAAALGVRRNSSYTSRNHLTTFNDLRARYSHPFFGDRVLATQLATIVVGNDSMFGDSGNDFVLGDSASLFVTYSTQTPNQRIISPNPAFELNYLNRENFELAGHYRRDAGASRISRDSIRGGNGNDSLYGQHRDDSVFGEAGNDLVYGGDGQVNVIDGGTGTNDARARGDDRPLGIPLRNLQNLVFAGLLGVFKSELVNLSETAAPPAGSLVFLPRITDGSTPPDFELMASMTPTDAFGGVRGQTRSLALSTNAPSANLVTYIVDWGDATAKQFISGTDPTTASHIFRNAGTYRVKITVIDAGTVTNTSIQRALTIGIKEVQGSTLAIGGTAANDAIVIAPGWNAGEGVNVTVNNVVLNTVTTSSLRHVAIYGGTGQDAVTVAGSNGNDRVVLGGSRLSINNVTLDSASIETWSLNGGGGTGDTLEGTNAANTWNVTSADAGMVGSFAFSSFENLTGGNGIDAFVFKTASSRLSGKIDGRGARDTLDYRALSSAVTVNLATGAATGTGGISNIEEIVGSRATNDRLVASSKLNNWQLDGVQTGTLDGLRFSGFAILTGGAGTDVFNFGVGAGSFGELDGGGGVRDRLDYTALVSPINVNLARSTATGAAKVGNFEDVTGGSGNDTVVGNGSGNVLIGGPGKDLLDGGAGNDSLDGGAGDDSLTGGVGSDVLIGGASNDSLVGGSGRDLLIGGTGKDTLLGETGEDILIGSTSAYSGDRAALNAIMSEWTGGNGFATRVSNLTNGVGAGGSIKLDATTVTDDAATADSLTGGAETDWFFKSPNDVLDALVGDGQVVTTI